MSHEILQAFPECAYESLDIRSPYNLKILGLVERETKKVTQPLKLLNLVVFELFVFNHDAIFEPNFLKKRSMAKWLIPVFKTVSSTPKIV